MSLCVHTDVDQIFITVLPSVFCHLNGLILNVLHFGSVLVSASAWAAISIAALTLDYRGVVESWVLLLGPWQAFYWDLLSGTCDADTDVMTFNLLFTSKWEMLSESGWFCWFPHSRYSVITRGMSFCFTRSCNSHAHIPVPHHSLL